MDETTKFLYSCWKIIDMADEVEVKIPRDVYDKIEERI